MTYKNRPLQLKPKTGQAVTQVTLSLMKNVNISWADQQHELFTHVH
jgi:hypothetical protein